MGDGPRIQFRFFPMSTNGGFTHTLFHEASPNWPKMVETWFKMAQKWQKLRKWQILTPWGRFSSNTASICSLSSRKKQERSTHGEKVLNSGRRPNSFKIYFSESRISEILPQVLLQFFVQYFFLTCRFDSRLIFNKMSQFHTLSENESSKKGTRCFTKGKYAKMGMIFNQFSSREKIEIST